MDVTNVDALEVAVERLAAERRELAELAWWRHYLLVATGGALASLAGVSVHVAVWSAAAREAGYAIAMVSLMLVLARRVLVDEVDQQIRRHRVAADTCYRNAARIMNQKERMLPC